MMIVHGYVARTKFSRPRVPQKPPFSTPVAFARSAWSVIVLGQEVKIVDNAHKRIERMAGKAYRETDGEMKLSPEIVGEAGEGNKNAGPGG